LRIQASLNLEACLGSAQLIVQRDYFVQETSTIPELGCSMVFTNDLRGGISVSATSSLSGVTSSDSRTF
jgi:hypothetical protein